MNEMMTIIIDFHQSHYRDCKAFYTTHVQQHLSQEFTNLISYTRFVCLTPAMLIALYAYFKSRYDQCSGMSYIDSTKIQVYHQ